MFVDLCPPKRRLPGAANDEVDVGLAFVVFTSCSICFSSCTGFGVTASRNVKLNGRKIKIDQRMNIKLNFSRPHCDSN